MQRVWEWSASAVEEVDGDRWVVIKSPRLSIIFGLRFAASLKAVEERGLGAKQRICFDIINVNVPIFVCILLVVRVEGIKWK
jgi:hypothetical protein